jgi:hypothetical protein
MDSQGALRSGFLKHFSGRAQSIAGGRTTRIEQHLQNRLDDLLASCADAQGRLNMGAQLRLRESQGGAGANKQQISASLAAAAKPPSVTTRTKIAMLVNLSIFHTLWL